MTTKEALPKKEVKPFFANSYAIIMKAAAQGDEDAQEALATLR